MNDSDAIHKIAKMFVKAGVTSSDIDVAKANANIACIIEKRRIEYLFTKQEMQKYLKLDEEKYEECISGDYDWTLRELADVAEKLDAHLKIEYYREIDYPSLSKGRKLLLMWS